MTYRTMSKLLTRTAQSSLHCPVGPSSTRLTAFPVECCTTWDKPARVHLSLFLDLLSLCLV